MREIIEILQRQCSQKIALREKRPGLWQVLIPFYHEDGDMVEVFITPLDNNVFRISDQGFTLMRLSYSYDIDTPNKERIFNTIISSYNIQNDRGNLYVDIDSEHLYPALMQFICAVLKVSNMKLYKREVIQSLFFEMLDEYIFTRLAEYEPQKDFHPLPDMPEYEVDYCFNHRRVPIYLFGVNSPAKARLTIISCQKFIIEKLKFRSITVLESLDCLGRNDQKRLMTAVDKIFPEFEEFEKSGEDYFKREMELMG
ncbi:DUF1828 domain-containing protein [hot springs metagenome]|uniref:DUF1828 domain-containing protein n=1 Tax=hot springs metagenome TaxID=433727 RepID=A0A5J4KZ65_9ZZZZ